jgi:hypothetical protein
VGEDRERSGLDAYATEKTAEARAGAQRIAGGIDFEGDQGSGVLRVHRVDAKGFCSRPSIWRMLRWGAQVPLPRRKFTCLRDRLPIRTPPG